MPPHSSSRRATAVRRRLAIGIAGLATLAACSPAGVAPLTTTVPPPPSSTSVPASSTTTTVAPRQPVLDPDGSYAVLVFTNHLPTFGFAEDGSVDRPWARLHTTRDYISMIRLVAETRVKVVLSFSPVLLEQIADVAAGRWDQAALITAKPANELSVEDKEYIDNVFFIAGPSQIDRFPRYRDLANKSEQGRQLSTNEYRDLQVLFNLSWTSPLLLEKEPLTSLVAQGRGFAEADKEVLLDTHRAAAAEFIESLRSLKAAGLIEVATTPLANPTLPLLIRNRMGQDAADQIQRGAELAATVLGHEAPGMAPAGGLIDQANANAVLDAGFEWLLLSEAGSSRPFQLTSEKGSLLALQALAEPGDRIAHTYFAIDPDAAALDMVDRMAESIVEPPVAVTTFVADGSEPWSRYEDGGLAFLRSLFQRLATTEDFATVLPSELNKSFRFDPGPYPDLPDTYLPSSNELAAWAFLADTRRELQRQRQAGTVNQSALDQAYDQVLRAQGADWYWWYSPQRASGEDAYYDESFRAGLAQVWSLLGSPAPDEAYTPLHSTEAVPASRLNRPTAADITIDNSIAAAEWSGAGIYDERTSDLIRRVYYTFDDSRLFVRVDFTTEVLGDSAPGFDLYLRGPAGTGPALTPRQNPLGFDAAVVAKWRGTNPVQISLIQPYRQDRTTSDDTRLVGFDGDSIEFELDLATVAPGIRAGDHIDFRMVDVSGGPEGTFFPVVARGGFEFPNLDEGIELARIADRIRDDTGPGTYSYTIDSQTPAGTYDLAELSVRLVGRPATPTPDAVGEVQFEITFREPLTNPWRAPAGFSHQTIDLYLDVGTAAGARRLLPGRVAATEDGATWDYAFTIDGWGGSQYLVDSTDIPSRSDSTVDYKLLADKRTILVTVPRSELPEGDETIWRYGVAVVANQAIPTLGIHGLRSLSAEPGRLGLGGGTGAANDPLIIDLLHPSAGAQEAALTYPAPASGPESGLSVEQLARLPLLAG